MSYSLTTDQSVYDEGRHRPLIKLTFTETNTGGEPVTVGVSPTDFTISQNNAAIRQSNPTSENQPPESETLLPGQLPKPQTATWYGTYHYSFFALTGASQGLRDQHFGAFVMSNLNAPAGLNAPFQITDPLSFSLTTDRSVYHSLGEPVRMNYTEVKSSDKPITVPREQPAGFDISHNGTPVMVDGTFLRHLFLRQRASIWPCRRVSPILRHGLGSRSPDHTPSAT